MITWLYTKQILHLLLDSCLQAMTITFAFPLGKKTLFAIALLPAVERMFRLYSMLNEDTIAFGLLRAVERMVLAIHPGKIWHFELTSVNNAKDILQAKYGISDN